MQKKLYTPKETKTTALLFLLFITLDFFYSTTSNDVIAAPKYINSLFLVAYLISFAGLVTYFSTHYQNLKPWAKLIFVTGLTLYLISTVLGYRYLFDFLSSLAG